MQAKGQYTATKKIAADIMVIHANLRGEGNTKESGPFQIKKQQHKAVSCLEFLTQLWGRSSVHTVYLHWHHKT